MGASHGPGRRCWDAGGGAGVLVACRVLIGSAGVLAGVLGAG